MLYCTMTELLTDGTFVNTYKFEWADPRCGKCVNLERANSIKICDCVCHSENNPYVKYHWVGLTENFEINWPKNLVQIVGVKNPTKMDK